MSIETEALAPPPVAARRVLDVTVVMPAFNRGPLITRALDSLRTQSCWPRQVIVVDDASTDDTAEQAAAWGRATGFPVRVERLARNSGAAAARNRAMQLGQTTYLAFLDSDDEHLPHTLERLVGALESTPGAVVAFGDATKVTPTEVFKHAMFERWVKPEAISERVGQSEPALYRLLDAKATLLRASIIPTCSTCFRRSDALAVGGMPQAYRTGEDWLFWLRLSERGSFVFYQEDLAVVHRHPDNLTHPGKAASTARHKLRGYLAILDGSAGFSTSEPQRDYIRGLMRQRAAEWRYQLSRLGLVSYLKGLYGAGSFSGSGMLAHLAADPKSVARALVSSFMAPKELSPD